MKNILLVSFFLFTLTLFASGQTATPTPDAADDDVVKISTNLIQVDVTVTDKKGNIITNLKSEDFEIFENGEKQEITNFSFVTSVKTQTEAVKTPVTNVPVPASELRAEQVRRTLALVVDDLSLSFESAHYVRRALKKFVDEQMQPGDLVAIIRTGAGIGALQQFTSDKRRLYAAIEKVRWNPAGNGKVGAFAPIEPTPLEQAKANGGIVSEEMLAAEKNAMQNLSDFRETKFVTGTLGALRYIVGGMRTLPGRKSVILFSDGFRLFNVNENGSLELSTITDFLRQLIDLANRASVVFYTIDARGLQPGALTAADSIIDTSGENLQVLTSGRRKEIFDTQQGLVYLARQTGGFPIINNNDLSGGVRKILDDQSYYLVGYQPDTDTFDVKTRRFNRLTVKVKRDDLNVRYRSGFFNVNEEKLAQATTNTNLTPLQQITTALSSPFAVSDISLRLNTLFGNDAKGSYVRSFLHISAEDLKFEDEADGMKRAVFDILAVSYGDNGIPTDQLAKTYELRARGDEYQKILREGFVYHFTFPVKKPGAYQYRVALRDSQASKVGSATQFIEVPNLKKDRLSVSGIVLENFTREQWQTLSNDAPKTNETQNMAAATNPLMDTSLRKFKRGTVLRYGYEIYNAKPDASKKPNLTTQIRVFRDDKLLLDGKPTPLELFGQTDMERIKAVGALSLGSEMPTGDYVLQIIITDNLAKEKQKITTQFVQFELVD